MQGGVGGGGGGKKGKNPAVNVKENSAYQLATGTHYKTTIYIYTEL